ncbi:alpha/beta hydrolase [Demetria terragena]|uniref:alpha/beta hydrolase n=1 Tax=Demetria terragena TaxID=63959 RepID=UPI000367E1D9|nr:alpha/beta hydrolase [Demetria terragena]
MSRLLPELDRIDTVEDPAAVVLVLHGGAKQSLQPVTHRSLSWQRARFLAKSLAAGLHEDRVAVHLIRYRVKGWNASPSNEPDPVRDARWALSTLAQDSSLPIVIVGHSMGARTAVAVADHPHVVGVVGLAGWLPADEPVEALAGKMVIAAHGRRDRITSFRATRTFIDRASEVAEAQFIDMGHRGHYLLQGITSWNRLARKSIREVLDLH